MHRKSLLTLLQDYQQRHPEEQECVSRFIAFVTSHSDCFQRSLQAGHVTGSAWLVNKTGTHVLLTHHRKLDIWVQLGGHADGETDILTVAMQEAEEESGLGDIIPVSTAIFDLDIHRIPVRPDEPEHYHHDVRFALQTTGDENYIVSDESHALAWIEIARLTSKTQEQSMLRMAHKWQGQWQWQRQQQHP